MLHDKPHFVSIHAKFGLATLVLGFLAPLGGAISFRRFGLLQRFSDRLQLRIKWFHRNVSVFYYHGAGCLACFQTAFYSPCMSRHNVPARHPQLGAIYKAKCADWQTAQIGLVTWLVALITIELALTHASVWRVSRP